MKANELRIGNLIGVALDGHHPIPCMVDGKIMRMLESESVDSFSPIPLGEKPLLMLGFQKRIYHSSGRGDEAPEQLISKQYEFDIDRNKITIIFHSDKSIHVGISFRKDKIYVGEQQVVFVNEKQYFVHQLQNLFFALTGCELNII